MKKRLLSLAVVLMMVGTVTVSAQNCVPDAQYTVPGIYPDSITNLPCAMAGELYDATITVVLPADTVSNTVVVNIDSIKVEDTTGDNVEVSGLPPNIVHGCEPSTCAFPGNSSGCLKLTGVPNMVDTGIHIIVVELVAYVTEPNFNISTSQDLDPLGYYSIHVVADSSECTTNWPIIAGLQDLDRTKIGILKNVPNPFEGETRIHFMLPTSSKIDFQVHNLLGSLVYSEQINGSVGLNKFVFSSRGMEAGVYIYSLNDGSSVASGRMVISE